jgi:hypothetical protein
VSLHAGTRRVRRPQSILAGRFGGNSLPLKTIVVLHKRSFQDIGYRTLASHAVSALTFHSRVRVFVGYPGVSRGISTNDQRRLPSFAGSGRKRDETTRALFASWCSLSQRTPAKKLSRSLEGPERIQQQQQQQQGGGVKSQTHNWRQADLHSRCRTHQPPPGSPAADDFFLYGEAGSTES